VQQLGGTYCVGKVSDFEIKPDIVMECSGAPSVIRDLLGSTAASGIVCLVGVTESGHELGVDIGAVNRTMVLENDTVFGTVNANRLHYEMASEVLTKADKAWLGALITRREPIANWTDALERKHDDIKVIVDFT
jgi:threonine dehydrogenase-like Zn-dependent dehydrogenase